MINRILSKKKILQRFILVVCLGNVSVYGEARLLPYQNKKLPVGERVRDLLGRMTTEEKIAELNLVAYYASRDSLCRAWIRQGKVGAFLKANGASLNRSLQEEAMKHSRLGIPLIFHEDVIHGYRTLTPIPLAEACSWDTVMVSQSSAVAAREAAASGIQLTYAPMVDISYDPRWGRIMETSGEDAFLGAAMAMARVRGFQGKNLSDIVTLAACVKHYVGYGALLAGRDYQNTDFSLRDLQERYLPPFQAAIRAGVASVMCSYTSYDGVPVTMNRYMNTDVLRKQLDFKGLYMTDWSTLNHAVEEGAAIDGAESSARALASGIDMDMASQQYSRQLLTLLNEGKIQPEWIDSAASRALELKFRMGLFDDPYAYFDDKRERKIVGSKEVRQAAYEMACESMVLLKNEAHTLPLHEGEKVLLAGPFATMKNDLMGSWTMLGRGEDVISVAEGMPDFFPKNNLILAGCAWNGINQTYIDQVCREAAKVSTVVICLGEFTFHIGEAVTTARLELPEEQLKLLDTVRRMNKKVVVVLFNGRPLVVDRILDHCDALLEAWYPGTMGGKAVAALLTGKENPSGKLVQTFPRHAGQVPIAYNFRRTFGKIEHADIPKGPQYPFGYGLSYTTYEYSSPKADKASYAVTDSVRVRLKVKNTGKRGGREVVQLYISDEVATIIPRVRELKGFMSVYLQPDQEREVEFVLPPSFFMIYNDRMEQVLEPGFFRIQTGPDSEHLQEIRISFMP